MQAGIFRSIRSSSIGQREFSPGVASPLLGDRPYPIDINDLDGHPFTTPVHGKFDLGAYAETICSMVSMAADRRPLPALPLFRLTVVLAGRHHIGSGTVQAMIIRSRPQNRTLLALGISLFVASDLAQADTFFCVDTAQKLQNALTDASDGGMHSGERNFIRLVTGTYNTTDTAGNITFHYDSTNAVGSLDISGGWTAGCIGTIRNAAASTVLDGNHTTQVMRLGSATTDIDVVGITLQNGETGSAGAGLAINTGAGRNGTVSVARTIIRNNHTTFQYGGIAVHSGGVGEITLFGNNLVTGNSADQEGGAGFLGSNGSTQIVQNTVYGNTTAASGGTGGLSLGGTGSFSVDNNIFRNNSNVGLYLATSNAGLYYDDYGLLGGTAPQQNVGALNVSPKFVDAAGGDFHLAGDSALLGISPLLTGTFDLEGHPSPTGGEMDLGAYEETIFIAGFDGG